MKKTSKIILSLIILAIIVVGGYYIYSFLMQKEETSSPQPQSDYYQNLANQCEKKSDSACCKASVDSMRLGSYKLSGNGRCPEGHGIGSLKCIDSYKWCEPQKGE